MSRWLWGFTAYAVGASTLGAAWVATRSFDVGFGRAVLWQAPIYLSWVVLGAGMRWLVVRALERFATPSAAMVGLLVVAPPLIAVHDLLAAAAGRWAIGAPIRVALVTRLPVELLAYLALSGVILAFSIQARARAQEIEKLQLEQVLARTQLKVLRSQLQPHFLFNALHVAAVLVEADPPAATRMIADLGMLLRRSLNAASEQQRPLQEELEIADLYLRIAGHRFGDRLVVTRDVAEAALALRVPDFVLQPLLENAVRHGVEVATAPVQLHLSATVEGDALVLRVQNSRHGTGARGDASTATGLTLVRERLRAHYGDRASLQLEVDETSARATVRLPREPPS